MKKTRSLLLLAGFVAILAVRTSVATAQTYLGEFCWGYSQDTGCLSCPGAGATYSLRAGVTHIGGPYYLIQGRVPLHSGPLFLHATGVVVGDEVWIAGSTTLGPTPFETMPKSGIMQARLELSTLDGSFWRIENYLSTPSGSFEQKLITGNVVLNGFCP